MEFCTRSRWILPAPLPFGFWKLFDFPFPDFPFRLSSRSSKSGGVPGFERPPKPPEAGRNFDTPDLSSLRSGTDDESFMSVSTSSAIGRKSQVNRTAMGAPLARQPSGFPRKRLSVSSTKGRLEPKWLRTVTSVYRNIYIYIYVCVPVTRDHCNPPGYVGWAPLNP